MWVHRRSEEPACTSVESYWKKSSLSKVGTSLKYLKANEFGATRSRGPPITNSPLFSQVREELKNRQVNVQILKHSDGYEAPDTITVSLHYCILSYAKTGRNDHEDFVSFLRQCISDRICGNVETLTRSQYKSALWHEMRYGRITASKAYDVMHCNKLDGSLVDSILGAYKVPDTKFMKRGRLLESKVINKLTQQLNLTIHNSGLFICQEYPFISVSPDGIGTDFIVEVKCPGSAKTFKHYINDNKITSKCKAQVQLQMHVTKKLECIFCVADPEFEKNNEIHILKVKYDEHYVTEMLNTLQQFWKTCIYPKIYESVKV